MVVAAQFVADEVHAPLTQGAPGALWRPRFHRLREEALIDGLEHHHGVYVNLRRLRKLEAFT